MKKPVSIIVLAVFLFCLASPVMASVPQPQISKEEALEIVKSRLSIPDNVKLNMVSYRYDYTGMQVWAFNWNNRNYKEPMDINAEVDAVTGRIRSFNRYSSASYGEAKYTLEQARAIAEDYVKAMNPDEYGQLWLEPSPQPDYGIPEKAGAKRMTAAEYYFKFDRIVNGYPYWDNGVNVTVSAANGSIMSYYFNWDNGDIPAVDCAVYRDQAKKIFNDKIGLELAYFKLWNEGNPDGTVTLGYYYPYSTQLYIDALTGEAVDIQGNAVGENSSGDTKPIAAEAGQAHASAGNSLTVSEAMILAKRWVSIPSGYILSSASYTENAQGATPAIWNFSWTDNRQAYINVGICNDTGELANLDASYAPDVTPRTEITQGEAAAIAGDFLKTAVPTKANQLRRDGNIYYSVKSEEKRPFYGFHFSRLVNGIPFADGGVDITVNGEGKVTTFWSNWENIGFPAADGIVNAGEASALLEKQLGFDLGYVKIYDGQGSWKTRLAYRINVDNGVYVDAKSGEVKHRWGGPLYAAKAGIEEVKGHWAEKDIRKLAGLNILDLDDGTIEPDQAVSRGEVVAMLARAFDLNEYLPAQPTFSDVPRDHKYYGYIEAAYKAGIIAGDDGKFNPEGEITREALAVVLVKGLKNLQTRDEISPEQFKDAADVAEWARDSVLKAAGLGLFRGDDRGKFNPRGKVTRAQAAAVIARALELKQ